MAAFKSRPPSLRTNRSGAVDVEDFEKAFRDYPTIAIQSFRHLEAEVASIQRDLANDKIDWEIKMAATKKLRALIANDAAEFDGFMPLMKRLEEPMRKAIADLRSQVCREACVSISYAAVVIGIHLDRFLVSILPSLFPLLPNSAKVMATSAHICILFLIRSVHSNLLLPVFMQNLSSKSSVIRRRCAEYLTEMLQKWPAKQLEKHAPSLQDAIVKMMADSDQAARAFGRNAYWHFSGHFKKRGDQLLTTFDANTRKLINQAKDKDAASKGGSASASGASLGPPKMASKAFHASAPDLSGQVLSGLHRKPTVPRQPVTSRASQRSHTDVASPVRQLTGAHGLSSTVTGNILRKPAQDKTPVAPSPLSSAAAHDPVRTWLETGSSSSYRHPHAPQSPFSRLATPKRRKHVGKSGGYLTKEALENLSKPHRTLSSGDFDDETGSVASDVSFSSTLSEMTSMRFNLIEDFDEILLLTNSSSWSDRKDSVLSLHTLFHTTKTFSKSDLKKITDACKRFFVEPHAKVFVLFLEMLCDFVRIFKCELTSWLFVLLLRLLHKMGSELRGSMARKMAVTLDIVRESFDHGLQFTTILRIILDQTQPMNNKVKLAVLNYLLLLIPQMDSDVIQNVSDVRLGVGKIITFTTEQRSLEVRRTSAKVLIALFEINTATFMMILSQLSKHFRDLATKVLQLHMKKEATVAPKSERPTVSAYTRAEEYVASLRKSASGELGTQKAIDSKIKPRPKSAERQDISSLVPVTSSSRMRTGIPLLHSAKAVPVSRVKEMRAKSPSTGTPPHGFGHLAASPVPRLQLQERVPVPQDRELSPTQPSVATSAVYNPGRYEDKSNGLSDQTEDSDDVGDFEIQTETANLLHDLTSAKSSSPQMLESALEKVIQLAKEDSFSFWEKHFDAILSKIYTHLKHETLSICTLTVRAFYEILLSQSLRFVSQTQTVVTVVLDTLRDSVEPVVKAMDELIGPFSQAVQPVECVSVLIPVIAKEHHSISVLLYAIRILTKVIERLTATELNAFLPQIMPVLVTAYSHSSSGVRKASVFCMVAIHFSAGEQMMAHTSQLTSSQMKLLNLYIKRAEAQATSPSSLDGR
eukprot:m.36515 g.36515  ORF g.36515 m.36515 type:complete len:1097 (+) comp32260_c0_seq3:79-3369(+)